MTSWDRSRRWVLYRRFDDRRRIAVVWPGSKPELRDLIALRRLMPQYAQTRPAELVRMMGSHGRLDLGEFPGQEAERLKAKSVELGLHLECTDVSRPHYLPVDITGEIPLTWLICDDSEAEQIVSEMLAAGVPVREAGSS